MTHISKIKVYGEDSLLLAEGIAAQFRDVGAVLAYMPETQTLELASALPRDQVVNKVEGFLQAESYDARVRPTDDADRIAVKPAVRAL